MSNKYLRLAIATVVIVVAAVAIIVLATRGPDLADDATTACVDATDRDSGIRVTLVTVWNGTPEFLPAGVGVSNTCIRPVHTFDDSSYVYIVGEKSYTVGDFFDVWPDSPATRPNATVENVSLNGQRYEDNYRDIVLQDEDRIVVAFGDRTPQ
ncbi:MAG: hypothetical protein OXN15_04010 [Chloroflexota bacterium]|nr:hypothetical protein [Chloroflexota bacterium]MDE2968875.1 hypothetical protein [Chloroflexota bacterium]